MNRRAFTLLETVLAASLTGLLLSLMLGLLSYGRREFLLALEDNDLANASYRAPRLIADQLRFSPAASLSSGQSGIAFLSAYDEQGRYVLDEQGRPLWQAYEHYFIEPGTHNLRHRRLAFEGDEAVPIEAHRLRALGPARLVARDIKAVSIEHQQQGWRLLLEVEHRRDSRTFGGEVELWVFPVE
ncbi:MAG: hypothetical protein KC910_00210 [Candidatus Eremiobacteraeota bacterium]|nr:hypothetical protein [Candidatus Eremiobacteraeota bacterium]